MAIEVLVIILVVTFAVVTVTVLVCGWAILALFRRGFRQKPWHGARVLCPQQRCSAPNPTTAQFCRRCGSRLHRARQSFARAAMW